MNVGVIIMLGAGANSLPAQMVWKAQQAATLDLIQQLSQNHLKIILSAPDFSWLPPLTDLIVEPDPPNRPFHFGNCLADLIQIHQLDYVLYFGGGSVPLFNAEILQKLIEALLAAKNPLVLTNNRHSSDWAAISHAKQASSLIRSLERDNSLAWLLGENFEVQIFSEVAARPALNLDIDTPIDLAILRLHPETLPNLKNFLVNQTTLDAIPLQQVMDILRREASQVTIAGRISPQAWLAINKVTRCWIRVFAEERGMVASERLKRGEVRSILYDLYKVQGAENFFATLADMSEAVILDSRVLMAAHYQFLPEERFTSDLFMPTADAWLNEFTRAAKNAPIPILLGGHSIVAGGLHAIAEMISRGV